MPLRLYPPRRKNPNWCVRGTLYGRTIYASAKTRDPKAAQRFKERLELELAKRDQQKHLPATFAIAAEMYMQSRRPKKADVGYLKRIVALIGNYNLADIRQHVLASAAHELHPKGTPATKNRQVLTMASAVLHYAAENNLCPYIKVKKFKERAPEPRSLRKEHARVLIATAQGQMKLLLTWLFYQGWRISDVLRLQWSDINLKAGIVRYHITKTDEWRDMPLHPKVADALTALGDRVGKVFHWSDKANLYRDLRPFCRKLGIHFTPHMARHSFATWLANEGASPMEIMEAGGWKDHKSVLRYAKLDPTRVRATIGKIGGI